MKTYFVHWLVVGSLFCAGCKSATPTSTYGVLSTATDTPTINAAATGTPQTLEPTVTPFPPRVAPTVTKTILPVICYEGPGKAYEPTSRNVPAGTQITLLGINSQGRNWLKVQVGAVVTNGNCWIGIEFVELNFEIASVPLVNTFVANQGTTCHSGPNAVYNKILVFINLLDELIILEKNTDQKWVLVPFTPDYPNPCWVALEKFTYDPSVIPQLPYVVVEPPFDTNLGGGNNNGGGGNDGGGGGGGGGVDGGDGGGGGGTNQTNTPTPDRPECSDGIDNDNDGAIDYGLDWGCNNDNDDSEDTVPQPP